jgi:hypothetical protein
MAQAAVHRAREASLRLAQILDKNRPVATGVWKPALGMIGAFSMLCLALLAHAPQLVAVNSGAMNSGTVNSGTMVSGTMNSGVMTNSSGAAYSAATSVPSLQISAAIPAALGTGRSQSVGTANGTSGRIVRAQNRLKDAAGDQVALAQPVKARMKSEPSQNQLIAISANANQEVPSFQTLVFIEATQYMTSDSSVWRVHVWRVTLVNTVGGRLATVPVINSI